MTRPPNSDHGPGDSLYTSIDVTTVHRPKYYLRYLWTGNRGIDFGLVGNRWPPNVFLPPFYCPAAKPTWVRKVFSLRKMTSCRRNQSRRSNTIKSLTRLITSRLLNGQIDASVSIFFFFIISIFISLLYTDHIIMMNKEELCTKGIMWSYSLIAQ